MEGTENFWVGFASIGVGCLLIVVLGLEVMIVNAERKISRKLDELIKK
ncbi:MAG: hypothetical protein JXB04_05225 [Kiritimatiellae bacterium]|nr:hypothetical protein [Kiritimatiellia bacterium]